ncbi:uncharacterized protein LOC124931343 [Impatiens glandulifera]|uniref:uncharacterized protein LOC124931343 n=1 Tax=Impatiens glandulifera TaxID=253017 RepID=UPI001FB069AC|nr:uncharacterized protein LOC124931343 [Impatiens glandulifera]
MANSSVGSTLKAYIIPLVLFAVSMVFQLFVTPRLFPTSHYDVLGVKSDSSIEEVKEAYKKLSINWNTGSEVIPVAELLKIQYAFELLSNPLWKRDYDNFGIDEHSHVVGKLKEIYTGADLSKLELPLVEATSFGPDNTFNVITSENFMSKFEDTKALLIQVFSFGSSRCANFANSWRRIADILDEVANVGMTELGEFQLAKDLAMSSFIGKYTFPDGVPAIVAFPPGCRTVNCLARYEGDLSVDTVTDWVASTILGLPRILYYSKDTLIQRFLAKGSPHKVKVIIFSNTGERATPFMRQAARDYHNYASFAFVLWQEEQFSLWFNMFGVESAPAIVFLKDPGLKPIVYYGPANNSWFQTIIEANKHQELPQLRSLTSMDLGCDAQGYSRAGHDITIWYCLILAGRLSPELNNMRATLRSLHEILLKEGEESSEGEKNQLPTTAAIALREKRLTLTWLDGEAQHRRCFFYLQTEKSYETCGRRMDIVDEPRIVIARFERNLTEESMDVEKKTPKNILEALRDDGDVHRASQLVAMYNGSYEIPQIIKWVSGIIEDGDSKSLPFFRARTPELVPEDSDPMWSNGAKNVVSASAAMKWKIRVIVKSFLEDPRIGPILLLVAFLSFGKIWLKRNQPAHQSPSKVETQKTAKEESKSNSNRKSEKKDNKSQLRRRRTEPNRDIPPSITDDEPKDAVQWELTDSDSE